MQVFVDHPIVISCPEHVKVQILSDDFDFAARHLQHRQADDLIVGGCEPLTIIIFKILFFDFKVKVDSERAKVRYLLWHVAIEVILLLLQGVLLRPVILNEGIANPILKGDGVGNSWLFGLIDSVEYLEDVCPYEFVIAINEKTDLISLTVLSRSGMNVRYCSHLFLIPYHHNFPLLDLILL